MPQAAYDLQRFARPEVVTKPVPRVRVAQKRQVKERTRQHSQTMRLVRTLAGLVFLLLLVCGVLYTQSTVTELQSQISQQKKELVEQEALNAYLTFEMENSTNMGQIEQRAEELGLRKATRDQIVYIRVQDEATVEVKQSPLEKLLSGARSGLLHIYEMLFDNGGDAG